MITFLRKIYLFTTNSPFSISHVEFKHNPAKRTSIIPITIFYLSCQSFSWKKMKPQLKHEKLAVLFQRSPNRNSTYATAHLGTLTVNIMRLAYVTLLIFYIAYKRQFLWRNRVFRKIDQPL